ncbi:MAG: aldehyde oxidase [Elusimicrobia bacterium HGW-Elusimicrobia-1]|jgi:putative selenate reductase molybdopterin-binding subunit|nr:MAG: aldehyde oxidase [Elusimicrobia bacterium HGW-Elusimicrobia-1]
MENNFKQVNQNVIKVDGVSLVTGGHVYTDDIELRGMLYAAVLWSPHAHARIKRIDVSKAKALPGVEAVLTHHDVPRIPFTTAGQGFPEPSPYDTFILDNKVRFVGDRVAAVAAITPEIAKKAVSLIEVEYEILPAVLDARKAMDKGAPVIHDEKEAVIPIPVHYEPEKNLAAHVDMEVGSVKKGVGEADVVLDYEYETHYATHVPMEPHVVITWLDENARLVIRTSTQVPFHVRRMVSRALDIPVKNIRVIKPRIGGGFGGKQEILIEDLCSALTLKTGKPVRIFYTRKEEFMSARTRHPQIIRLKTGVKKDGTITSVDLNIIMNTGAYGSHALTVLSNSGSKLLPLWKCENVRFWGDTVYTNLPVGGAYRGYGATQSYFAMGIQIDEMAEKIKMDVVDFCLKNHIRTGDGSPVFQALGEGKAGVEQKIGSCGLKECIELGAKEIGWKEKRETYAAERKSPGRYKKGVGMVALMQGSSIPEIDMGAASLKMNEDGSFNMLLGATDLGTGSDTIFAQMVAEVLGIDAHEVIVYSSDTDMTPFDVGAYASSTTYLSGYAVIKAAEKVKEQILKVASEMLEEEWENLTIGDGKVTGKNGSKTLSEIAIYSLYEKNQFQIASHASHITHKSPPPFSAHYAEVEVDTWTGKVRVIKYVAAVDCGTPINPQLAEGQTEGAVMNGLSYALTERYIFDEKGKMLNPSLNYFKIFSTADMPDLKTILVPTYEETGPFGAKSVSEIGINGPMPAISNAIYNAVGVRIRKSPFTPETVLAAIEAKK